MSIETTFMKNSPNIIVFVAGLIAIMSLLALIGYQFVQGSKLRECPDEWIIPNSRKPLADTEHFFMNGRRRELAEFNLEWVKENCQITRKEVF